MVLSIILRKLPTHHGEISIIDQGLCVHFLDSTIPLLFKSEYSVAILPGLCVRNLEDLFSQVTAHLYGILYF